MIKKILLLSVLFSFFGAYSQTYRVDRMEGMNMKKQNMTFVFTDNEVIMDLKTGNIVNTPIIDIEEKEGKVYYYAAFVPPVEDVYFVVYTNKKKQFIDFVTVYLGTEQKFTYEVSLVE